MLAAIQRAINQSQEGSRKIESIVLLIDTPICDEPKGW